MNKIFNTSVLALALGISITAHSQAKDIKIALVQDLTGVLAPYAKASVNGFNIGLDYATQGTRMVGGNKIVVVTRDNQGKPDVGKAQITAAFADDDADIAIGPVSSAVALAMLPVALEYKKILIVDQSVAASVTGDKSNRYVFRTQFNSDQDAAANAAAMDKPGVSIATLAQDYAYGRDGVAALKKLLKNATVVHEEYIPPGTVDFTAPAQRLLEALRDKTGPKIIYTIWAPPGNPYKILDLEPKRYGIDVFSSLNLTLAALKEVKPYAGLEGSTSYYYGLLKNPMNDYLIEENTKRYNSPPDFGTVAGFNAALLAVQALKKTNGDAGADALIGAIEDMEFDTPKGKFKIRKEDHQALQSMFHVRLKNDPSLEWAVPEMVEEIKPEQMTVTVGTWRK